MSRLSPYSTENAIVDSLGTVPSLLNAPQLYGFDTTSYIPTHVNSQDNPMVSPPHSEENLATATLINASSAAPTSLSAGAFKYLYYDTQPYKGKPTRSFAVVKIPPSASLTNKVPGIVLVHGGGGTAFVEWVELWAAKGYAAISISVEGQINRKDRALPQINTEWNSHDMAGPVRENIYNDTKPPIQKSLEDQWIYHAVSDTILANSLLRALPFIDEDKVGLMGVSWGGVITATTIGIDSRFAFAIPTYGCGHLFNATNAYGYHLNDNSLYKNVWDPILRAKRITTPTLWLSYPQEAHFPLKSQALTYRALEGSTMISLPNQLGHSHESAWRPLDSYYFAESVINQGTAWASQQSLTLTGNTVSVTFSSTKSLTAATLLTTSDYPVITSDISLNIEWRETSLPAPVSNGTGTYTITGTLPPGTTSYFINATHETNEGGRSLITVSSEYQEITEDANTYF